VRRRRARARDGPGLATHFHGRCACRTGTQLLSLGAPTRFSEHVDPALASQPTTFDKIHRKGIRAEDAWGFVYTRCVQRAAVLAGERSSATLTDEDGHGRWAGMLPSGTTGLPKVCLLAARHAWLAGCVR